MSDSIKIRLASVADAEAYAGFLAGLAAENLATLAPAAGTLGLVQARDQLLAHGVAGSALFLAEHANELLGTLALSRCAQAELAHVVRLDLKVRNGARGHGVGAALLRQGLAWLAASPVIERIELEVMSNNPAAIRLYERCGFAHEGVRRQAVRRNGAVFDLHVMGILKGEVNAVRPFCDPDILC